MKNIWGGRSSPPFSFPQRGQMDIHIPDGRDQAAIVPLRFWTDYEPDGAGGFREVEFVQWTRKGSNGATTEDKVARVKRDTLKWPVLERFYEHWKKGQDAPVDGTPLEAWPGITREQIAVLKSVHLGSIEDFASASDGVLDKLNIPAIRGLQQKAKAFLANRSSAAAAAAIAERDERIAFLETQLAELAALVETLRPPGAFSEEVAAGSSKENATKGKAGASFEEADAGSSKENATGQRALAEAGPKRPPARARKERAAPPAGQGGEPGEAVR